jgi:hypothetical protein
MPKCARRSVELKVGERDQSDQTNGERSKQRAQRDVEEAFQTVKKTVADMETGIKAAWVLLIASALGSNTRWVCDHRNWQLRWFGGPGRKKAARRPKGDVATINSRAASVGSGAVKRTPPTAERPNP